MSTSQLETDVPTTDEVQLLRLDLGCGSKKEPGWYGVDSIAFEGIDAVVDLTGPWPWADDSVDEARAVHVLEHFTASERCHFMNELWRVLKPGCKAFFVCPHWASQRAYGDPTHQWPPIGAFFIYYLSRKWRETDAPHTDDRHNPGFYKCNFEANAGYGIHPFINQKCSEAREFAMQFYIEATPDIMFTLTKHPYDKDF